MVVNTEVVIINNVTQVVQIGGDNSTSTLLQREINAFLSSFKVRLCDLALLNLFTPRMRLHIWVTHSYMVCHDVFIQQSGDAVVWISFGTLHVREFWHTTYEWVMAHHVWVSHGTLRMNKSWHATFYADVVARIHHGTLHMSESCHADFCLYEWQLHE